MASREIMKKKRWRLAVLRHAFDLTNNVALTCRLLGVSRTTFYIWKKRWMAEGGEGLGPRSRRPLRQPRRTPTEVVVKILYWRIVLGLSPLTIRGRLAGECGVRLSAPGVWKILKRLGLSRKSSWSLSRRTRTGGTGPAFPGVGTVRLTVRRVPSGGSGRKAAREFLYIAREGETGFSVRRSFRSRDPKTSVEFLEHALAWLPLKAEAIETGPEPAFHGYFHWHVLSLGIDHVVKTTRSAESEMLTGGRGGLRREGAAHLPGGVFLENEPLFNQKLAQWNSLAETGRPQIQRTGR
jgi:transposase